MKQLDNYIQEKLKLNKDYKDPSENKDWSIKTAEDGDFVRYNNRELFFIYKCLNTDHKYSNYVSEDYIVYYAILNNAIKSIRLGPQIGVGDTNQHFDLATKDQKENFLRILKDKGYKWDEDKKEIIKIN